MPKIIAHAILPKPTDLNWVLTLKPGDTVWLVKQQCYALVYDAWTADVGQHIGQLQVHYYDDYAKRFIRPMWWVSSDGAGFDGGQLLLPCASSYVSEPVCAYSRLLNNLPKTGRVILRT